jgi:hypothetical protein
MTTLLDSDADVIREASDVLMNHLSPAKFARFWALWQAGHGEYLQWRDETFGAQSVAELVQAIQLFEATTEDPHRPK